MASTLAFLTETGSRSCLFRHWTLVILIASLLSVDQLGILMVVAQQDMVLSAIPTDKLPESVPNVASDKNPIQIFNVPADYSFVGNALVTVPLSNVPNIPNMKAVLMISSPNDSISSNFLIQVNNPPQPPRSKIGEAILYGFLGVTITNLCALTGLICIPIRRSRYYDLLITFMIALAVGALFSTALLVLIPEAMRMVDMPLEFGGQGRTYLIKLGCVIVGGLFFFTIEYILLIIPRFFKPDGERSSASVDGDNNRHGHSHCLKKTVADQSDIIEIDDKAVEAGELASSELYTNDDASIVKPPRRRGCGLRCSRDKCLNISPVAWMILFGDGFHNLMDGLTIGAGFTQSPVVGITLSLSILFEELPHELGDFAVLISSGFSVKAAICANFASACSAYIGLIIGLVIGEVTEGAFYVFAITAGFFLYISLSDMLPTLRAAIEEAEQKRQNSFKLFVLQFCGLLTGIGCVVGVTLCSDYISL